MTLPAREQAAIPEFIRKGECRYRNGEPALTFTSESGGVLSKDERGDVHFHSINGAHVPAGYPGSPYDLIPLAPEREGGEDFVASIMAEVREIGEMIWQAGKEKEPCVIGPIPYALDELEKRLREGCTPPAPPVAPQDLPPGHRELTEEEKLRKLVHWLRDTEPSAKSQDEAAAVIEKLASDLHSYKVANKELWERIDGKPADQAEGAVISPREAVALIVRDIEDRKGLKHEWRNIEADVVAEITQAWEAIVNRVREVAGAGVAEFRYFIGPVGYRWKMPIDGSRGYLMKPKRDRWEMCVQNYTLRDCLHPGALTETTEDGTPLA